MKFDFLEKLGEQINKELDNKSKDITESIDNHKNNIESGNVTQDEIELAVKLNAIIDYVVDRFEGNIAICENQQTNKMEEIEKDKLPEGIKEGDVLQCINGKYLKNEKEQIIREKRIEEKMNNLWK